MRWRKGRRSQNMEDRRGPRGRRRGLAGDGIGTLVLVLAAMYFGNASHPNTNHHKIDSAHFAVKACKVLY